VCIMSSNALHLRLSRQYIQHFEPVSSLPSESSDGHEIKKEAHELSLEER